MPTRCRSAATTSPWIWREGLSTRLEDAERLKVMHGSALPASADDRDIVTIQPIGDDDGEVPLQVPRSVMTRIIRARVEETLEIAARPARTSPATATWSASASC